jgi:carboxymethylenebutenolidase
MEEVTLGNWNYLLYHGKLPVGIVLVHDFRGRDHYAKSVAEQLSEKGFWVAAVDLFHGRTAERREDAAKLVQTVKADEVIPCLAQAHDLLTERIGPKGVVGTMGFCMGGGFALLGACNLPYDFCIDFYGMIQNILEVEGLKGPVLLILGSEDARVTPWAFETFLPAAIQHKVRVDVHLYPNAPHAFHRPGDDAYRPEAAKDAWAKTLAFLDGMMLPRQPHALP